MNITTIANRYARALADVSAERGVVDQVLADLTKFDGLLGSHAELRQVLATPTISLERKRGVLDALLARLTFQPTTVNFLQLLLANGRLHQLDQMLRALSRELDARAGIVAAEITTARELNGDQRDALERQLSTATGGRVRLQFRTDPALLGGLVARIGSTVYDGSIRNQLTQLRQQMLNVRS
jgi:F-type H+-transporting ATPase subunit delta